ncbi:connectin-like [Pollicipes pollicipes]|uniref:connectin-like n=1 Tax=Pollicipes pollicipes TaxID=41117 RepID=UPI00188542FD|nr:connectin-like [Pollicipes pollicipes]
MSCRPRSLLLSLAALAALLTPFSVAKKGEAVPAAPPFDPETLENVCDLRDMVQAVYCYCDFLEKNDGETASCWVYNTTRTADRIWDTFYHQTGLHRLTINLRGNGSLDAVPTRALTYTRHLWVLDIKNARIHSVHPDAFARSTSITDISLAGNSIEQLERHAFSELTNLTRLNIGENKLHVVNRNVFVRLPRLKQLYLDRNRIARIRNTAFVKLENLQELELYGNRLKAVSRGTFKGLHRLQRLDLHRNQLEVIGDRTFAEMSSLKELDLAENHIKYIGGHGLEGLPRLMRLNLENNRLVNLLPGTFEHAPEIFYLNLQRNLLETLDERTFRPIMDNMKNITMYFYMAENRLRCDCRLAWLMKLRSRTASSHVKAALDSATCQMEPGASSTPDPAPSDGLRGAGPALQLTDLKASDLPCDRPLAEEPVAKEEQAPAQEPPQEQHKLRSSLSAPPQRARSSQVTAPAPATAAGQVKASRDSGGAAGLTTHLSLLVLTAALAVAR